MVYKKSDCQVNATPFFSQKCFHKSYQPTKQNITRVYWSDGNPKIKYMSLDIKKYLHFV